MRLSHFFIDRPIFAAVIAIILTLVGAISFRALPISEYPEIAPPTVEVTATFAGASAEVVSQTVATPIEQEINGVDNMIYLVSQATGDGAVSIDAVFKPGTDVDQAQVLVQNRVSIALPRLPEEVQHVGVTVRKKSPDLLLVIHLISPDKTLDQQYISNYATVNIRDVIARVDGVGDTIVFGARDYAMRIWLDPAKLQSRSLTASDAVAALQAANVQVAAGAINQPPAKSPGAFQIAVQTLGRLSTPAQFEDIVVATDPDGSVTHLRDIARVELGSQDYTVNAYLNNQVATAIGIFQRPGSNALATANNVLRTMEELSKSFPQGLQYRVAYNTTEFIQQSVDEVIKTLFEAVLLVVIVIVLFLQSWRAAIIPIVAIPVSIVGSFFVLEAFGFSINNLTLFGLVLAIGIVVDDAIVVVENVERYLRQGLSPRDAAHKTMDEVGSALIAIGLVLCAVFIPTAFITGISGAFYKQFALTITASTIISVILSLTLSPALAALFLRPHDQEPRRGFWRTVALPFDVFFAGFNKGFEKLASSYAGLTRRALRVSGLMLVLYGLLIGLTYFGFSRAPSGFIPQLDRGYFIAVFSLPPGSSLDRTDRVVREASDILLSRPGVANTVMFAGFDGATFTNAPNLGVIFVTLKPFEERVKAGLATATILNDLRSQMQALREASILILPPPSVPGIGTGGGFKLYVQDRADRGPHALEQAVARSRGRPIGRPASLRSSRFSIRRRRRSMPISIGPGPRCSACRSRASSTPCRPIWARPSSTSSTSSGGLSASSPKPTTPIGCRYGTSRICEPAPHPATWCRSGRSPLSRTSPVHTACRAITCFRPRRCRARHCRAFQPARQSPRWSALPRQTCRRVSATNGPRLRSQEKVAGNTAIVAFSLAVVFVFLLLAAQYESVLLPLAVILIVPMCLFAAISGVLLRGMDNNILTQIGFVVLIGLAAKNAILIVEFAKQAEERGADRFDAAVQAARTRLRPILMTSFAFIFGVVPLALATGAGAEMRQALGTAVFFGMLGVTMFGLLFTPVFYVLVRWIGSLRRARSS